MDIAEKLIPYFWSPHMGHGTGKFSCRGEEFVPILLEIAELGITPLGMYDYSVQEWGATRKTYPLSVAPDGILLYSSPSYALINLTNKVLSDVGAELGLPNEEVHGLVLESDLFEPDLESGTPTCFRYLGDTVTEIVVTMEQWLEYKALWTSSS